MNGDENMRQTIPFVKDISFNSKIAEITSISLEHNLKMENNDSVVGTFTISGKYKVNKISINEEEFKKDINFDITLDDKYDSSKVIIDIDDFYYEIVNEEYLRVHIDVLIDNLLYIKKEEKPFIQEIEKNDLTELKTEERISNVNDLKDISFEEEKENAIKQDNDTIKKDDKESSITTNFLNEKEQYITYKVHIIRENETVDTIIEKYNVSKEELEKYNSLDNVGLGTKIIVPISSE